MLPANPPRAVRLLHVVCGSLPRFGLPAATVRTCTLAWYTPCLSTVQEMLLVPQLPTSQPIPRTPFLSVPPSSPNLLQSAVRLPRRHRHSRNPPHHRPEQPPRHMSFRQPPPVALGMFEYALGNTSRGLPDDARCLHVHPAIKSKTCPADECTGQRVRDRWCKWL